jgi:peptidoglycan/xylan/chitin deacetylase (PgdA/CDA1 family)
MISPLCAGLSSGSYFRSVNYHSTPRRHLARYRQQVAGLARHFSGVNEAELRAFFETGRWSKEKPGLIFAFYNGYRNTYQVMRPLLEQHGFTGWFFVPTDFLSTAPEQQADFAARHGMVAPGDEFGDGRVAMSWDEVRDLDGDHVISSHTKTHARVTLENPDDLRREIVGPQADFLRELGRPAGAFAWLLGSPLGEHLLADALVQEAGYEWLFSNHKIQRVPPGPDGLGYAGSTLKPA